MKVYSLKRTQFLPISLEEAWNFFSSPKNLQVITPAKLNFKILSISGGDKMHEGQIIKYKVNVLPFVRMRWVTEITNVKPYHYFTDDQKSGPYKLWQHKHQFTEVPGGVEMLDEINYAVPLGIAGRLANFIFVEREVRRIFDYRFTLLESHFKKKEETLAS